MCNDATLFKNNRISQIKQIEMANKQKLRVDSEGDVIFDLNNNKKIKLHDVLYIPNIEPNLLSVTRINMKVLKQILKIILV